MHFNKNHVCMGISMHARLLISEFLCTLLSCILSYLTKNTSPFDVWGIIQINFPGSPSVPTIDDKIYSVTDSTTAMVTFLATSNGSFGTGVSYLGSLVGNSGGSVNVAGNRFILTGLNYTESYTASVVATSAVCPGVLNSTTIINMNFNIESKWFLL